LLRRNGAGNADLLSVHEIPSAKDARQMPRHPSDISGEGLYILCHGHKDVEAIREALRREAMAVDGIEYEETSKVVLQLNDANSDWLWLQRLPYQVSIYSALIAGWASLPLVFHEQTAVLFNEYLVHGDALEADVTRTCFNIGTWTWGWMEPQLGTVSFFLLCVQFAREQAMELGIRPFTDRRKKAMGTALVAKFPQYNPKLVRAYAEATALKKNEREAIMVEQAYIEAKMAALRAKRIAQGFPIHGAEFIDAART